MKMFFLGMMVGWTPALIILAAALWNGAPWFTPEHMPRGEGN
jgi:hypothetical protein